MSQQSIEQDREKRRRRRAIQTVAETLAAPVITLLILLIWQFGAPAIGLSDFVLPTPWQIIKRIGTDYRLLFTNSLVSLLEILAGFLIAATTGVLTALMIFYSRIFERAFYPLLVALQTIPKVALAPLLVLYLGYDFAPKCFLAFLLAYFPIVISTVVGLQALDKSMVSLVRSMGANEWQTFFKIRLPAALPNIFAGLKVGVQSRRYWRRYRRIRRRRARSGVSAAPGKLSFRHDVELCGGRGDRNDWRPAILGARIP